MTITSRYYTNFARKPRKKRTPAPVPHAAKPATPPAAESLFRTAIPERDFEGNLKMARALEREEERKRSEGQKNASTREETLHHAMLAARHAPLGSPTRESATRMWNELMTREPRFSPLDQMNLCFHATAKIPEDHSLAQAAARLWLPAAKAYREQEPLNPDAFILAQLRERPVFVAAIKNSDEPEPPVNKPHFEAPPPIQPRLSPFLLETDTVWGRRSQNEEMEADQDEAAPAENVHQKRDPRPAGLKDEAPKAGKKTGAAVAGHPWRSGTKPEKAEAQKPAGTAAQPKRKPGRPRKNPQPS